MYLYIFFREVVRPVGLHIEHADHLATDGHGCRQFGARAGQHRVGQKVGRARHIIDDHGLTAADRAGHEAVLRAHRDTVPTDDHLLAGFTCARRQLQVFMLFI